jgi:hypothetical protein
VKEALEKPPTRKGGNRLGRILMTIREDYQKKAPPPSQIEDLGSQIENPAAEVPSGTTNVTSGEPEIDPRDELLDIGDDDSDLYTGSSAAPVATTKTTQHYEEDEIDYSE